MDKFYLGVAREIITPKVACQMYGYVPDLFSEYVADDLTATAFYMRQGQVKALMVSVTVCLIQTALAEKILSLVEETYGISKEHCILSATHTHSGPNTAGTYGWGDIDRKYCEEILIPRILGAVGRAVVNAQSVTVGMACGECYAGVNRRQLNLQNKAQLGQNDWGVFDPRMCVISFCDEGGKVLANMIHYGMHGTTAGRNPGISRDWSGVMTDLLEKTSGGITAFFNGAEGDVGPRLSNGLSWGFGRAEVEEIGYVAGKDAVRIFKSIPVYGDVSLYASQTLVNLPLEKRIDYRTAQEKYSQFQKETVNLEGSLKKHYEDLIASYENGFQDEQFSAFPQTQIRIGDAVFVSFPFELFCEISMRIDRASKIPYVLSLSNANGSEGYFVSQGQICYGGYEVSMFKNGHLQAYCDDADSHAIQQTLDHLE